MTALQPAGFPLAAPISASAKRKRVLLVDTSQATRELRAEVMKKLGIDVDCAADIVEARSWWKADFYDLVLINMVTGHAHRDKFCYDVRNATPPQRLAFLVGQPDYLANSPRLDDALVDNSCESVPADMKVPAHETPESRRWGILEASRRISAVRSASLARTRAIHALPTPPRDSEGRAPRNTVLPNRLNEVSKEEL